MNKKEFLTQLRRELSGIPQEDIEERVIFYSEMIDDRIEEGIPEKEAIAELGSAENIVKQIKSEIPLTKLVKERIKPNRTLQVWEIVLLALGSPVWLSLLVALLSVALAVYAVIWSLILSLWAIEISIVVCAGVGILYSVVFAVQGDMSSGIAILGSGLVCVGLMIFGFIGCKHAVKAIATLTGRIFVRIKFCFMKKETIK